MNIGLQNRARGFSLVELIVVLAILAGITALAIPAFMTGGGSFASDPTGRTARDVQSLLRAARIYAITHNVSTAVVYNMDNYVSAEFMPANDIPIVAAGGTPLVDTVTNQTVRALNAAAIMYAYPNTNGMITTGDENTTDPQLFVPVNSEEGIWRPFDGDVVLSLRDPDKAFLCPLYVSDYPRYNPDANLAGGDNCTDDTIAVENVTRLGMREKGVLVPAEGYGPLSGDRGSIKWNGVLVERFLAHVFDGQGRLDVSPTQERFTFLVAPSPTAGVNDRLVLTNLSSVRDTEGNINLMSIPIDIYRSSGRAKIASE